MLRAKFGYIGTEVLENFFKIKFNRLMYFRNFVIISPRKFEQT